LGIGISSIAEGVRLSKGETRVVAEGEVHTVLIRGLGFRLNVSGCGTWYKRSVQGRATQGSCPVSVDAVCFDALGRFRVSAVNTFLKIDPLMVPR
jgi:hypothetical protein